ncbi:MAG: 30S ribosomal protein S17 [Fervidicoccaceae archaeon]
MPRKKEEKNPGIEGIQIPSKKCEDPNCPFHGTIKVRGLVIEGVISSDKMDGTVVIEHNYMIFDRKYRRYERRRSKIHAHLPPCVEVKVGDKVLIGETRPISKTVSFVVLGKVR